MTYASGVTTARIAAAAAAALLLSPAAAPASIWPAPAQRTTQTAHRLVLVRGKPSRVTARGCSAHVKEARWLAPVACEQPPRSTPLLLPLLGG